MSRISALAVAVTLSGLMVSAPVGAQMPQAGAAGAGNSAISGVPFGPANPSVLSDPSGIGNASRIPPPGTNAPLPPRVYGPIASSPSRVVVPHVGASQRIFSADQVETRKPPVRRRGRTRVSRFTGICRGC